MNQRVSAILVVALLVSAAATYIVYRLVSSRANRQASVATTEVVQAAHPLEIGALIKDEDLKTGPWVGTVPVGMATKKDSLIGRGVIAPIYEGEPIIETRLAPLGAGAGLAATIPPGMRAVAVRVNDIVGVAGFAVPGMRVDVLISGNPPQGTQNAGPVVRTLLQNIEVLTAGQNYQKDAEGKPVVVQVVNLLVTPEQAEILSLASNETRIQLVLRNPLDTQPAKVPGTAVASLYGAASKPVPVVASRPRPPVVAKPEAAPPKAAPLPPFHIEILNGDKRSEAQFARPEAKQ